MADSSVKTSAIIEIMERLAPEVLAVEYDNAGLIVGEVDKVISRVLVALDLSDRVAEEAADIGADIIITHHPMIYKPALKKITTGTALGRRIFFLIKNNISAYAAHTNLDIAAGGTNDALFTLLGLINKEGLDERDLPSGETLGRVGELERGVTLREFCLTVKEKLGIEKISFAGDPNAIIRRVGLCTGSASEIKYLLAASAKKCDAYLTGDVTYHDAQAALELGLALIDGTHYATEALIIPALAGYLRNALAGTGVEVFETKVGRSFLQVI